MVHRTHASIVWYTSREQTTAPIPYVLTCQLSICRLTTRKSCISEAQKYQGALYRPEKEKKSKQNYSQDLVPHKAYVEDADDEYHHNSHITIVDPPMPEAPSPPSAAPGFAMSSSPVNVFDFLVNGETPNASRLELPPPEPMHLIADVPEENYDRALVKVSFDKSSHSDLDLIEYGKGPVPTSAYQTPGPKFERERKKEKKDRDLSREEKRDKKRKRLHVDTQSLRDADETMTDAPPVLHSGLTGGLKGLLARPSVFPPSPDYSGGDANDNSPGSPLKKTKHSKRGRNGIDQISNNIMSLISTKRVSSREHSEDRPRRKHRRHRDDSERPVRKMIEYKPLNEDGAVQEDSANQMVIYKPRAELLLGYINKGPESERGVSMNKALKRYHRDRNAMGVGLTKAEEEKELWRSLRMKRNDRGEIVLFL
jgi:cell growth-regulating nucleolar protein